MCAKWVRRNVTCFLFLNVHIMILDSRRKKKGWNEEIQAFKNKLNKPESSETYLKCHISPTGADLLVTNHKWSWREHQVLYDDILKLCRSTKTTHFNNELSCLPRVVHVWVTTNRPVIVRLYNLPMTQLQLVSSVRTWTWWLGELKHLMPVWHCTDFQFTDWTSIFMCEQLKD